MTTWCCFCTGGQIVNWLAMGSAMRCRRGCIGRFCGAWSKQGEIDTILICDNCGKKFERHPSNVFPNRYVFCNTSCRREFRQRPFSYDDVLDFIVKYVLEHGGVSPTYREIADNCEVSSTSQVKCVLDQLAKAGLIVLLGDGRARGIQVVGMQLTYTDPRGIWKWRKCFEFRRWYSSKNINTGCQWSKLLFLYPRITEQDLEQVVFWSDITGFSQMTQGIGTILFPLQSGQSTIFLLYCKKVVLQRKQANFLVLVWYPDFLPFAAHFLLQYILPFDL